MNIFLLDPIKFITKDGCNIHRIELIRNFSKLNHNVFFFTKGEISESFKDIFEKSFIHTKHISSNKLTFVPSYLYYSFLLLTKERFNVLYTRNAIFCGFGLIFKKISHSIIIFEKNGIISDESNLCQKFRINNVTRRWQYKIYYHDFLENMELFFLKYCDVIITVTPLIKEYLIDNGIYKEKIHVIENGANIDLFKPQDMYKTRNELGLDNNKTYVCFVGNLASWQGLEYLIHAAQLVIKKKVVDFLIVGDGAIRKKLEKIVNDLGLNEYFIFTGIVPYKDVPKYINASDICVAPFSKNRNERIGLSPLKIYEYMACGKPVVSSRIPNLEFIEKQNAGILVEPENPIKLSEAIIKVLDKKNLHDLSINSREYIVKYHSWKNVAQKVTNVCEISLAKKNNSDH